MSYAAERSPIDIDEFERRLRGPAPRPTGDPLAELARLVAPADAKPEALDALFARPQSSPEATWAMGNEDAHGMHLGEMRGSVAEGHDFAPDAFDHVYDRAASSDDHYTGNAELTEDWQPRTEDRFAPEADKPRSKRPLYATAAVIAVGLLGVGSTFAFKGHRGGDGELVQVKAAPGPTKVQAQAAAADSNSTSANSTVLDRGVTPQPVTRVINRQEQPVDVREAARSSRATAGVGSGQMASFAAAASGGGNGSIFAEPRKVKTVSVRPDGSIVGSAAVDAQGGASSQAQTSGTQTPQPVARNGSTPKTVTRVAATPKPPVDKPDLALKPSPAKADGPAKPVTAKPVAAKPAAAKVAKVEADADDAGDNEPAAPVAARASGGGGGFAVQLAAPGNEAEARSVANRLGQRFSGELGGTRVTVQKAGDKAIYRVRTASMSREDAVSACEKIKAAGGACFVAKN